MKPLGEMPSLCHSSSIFIISIISLAFSVAFFVFFRKHCHEPFHLNALPGVIYTSKTSYNVRMTGQHLQFRERIQRLIIHHLGHFTVSKLHTKNKN